MKIVIDENVSYGLVETLQMRGHEVMATNPKPTSAQLVREVILFPQLRSK